MQPIQTYQFYSVIISGISHTHTHTPWDKHRTRIKTNTYKDHKKLTCPLANQWKQTVWNFLKKGKVSALPYSPKISEVK